MVVHHYELESHAEKLGCYLRGQGHTKDLWKNYIIKRWLLLCVCIYIYIYVSSELIILFQPNLGWWWITTSQSVKWKCYIAMFKVKASVKVHNFIICLFGYLLNCWTFCSQTWYEDASTWAGVFCKKIALLSSRSRSQWGLILEMKMWPFFLLQLQNCWSFCNQAYQ